MITPPVFFAICGLVVLWIVWLYFTRARRSGRIETLLDEMADLEGKKNTAESLLGQRNQKIIEIESERDAAVADERALQTDHESLKDESLALQQVNNDLADENKEQVARLGTLEAQNEGAAERIAQLERAAQARYDEGYKKGYDAHVEATGTLRKETEVITIRLKESARKRTVLHFMDGGKVIARSPTGYGTPERARSVAERYVRCRYEVEE